MENETYDQLNRAWKSTCRVLLGENIGELEDYASWLLEYVTPVRKEKSTISGKPVSLTIPDYARAAKFISFDEIDFSKKFEPLNINEIKDIDNLLQAVQERISYTGNVILGNSAFVENSSNVLDSRYIYNCSTITSDSKYVAYCDSTRESEFEFGCYSCGDSGHLLKCTELFSSKRCFEAHGTHISTDVYYSYSVKNCSEALFSFGALSKKHIIGNLELPKERYYQIKQKIISELVEKIKKEKTAFSLLEIIEKSGDYQGKIQTESGAESKFDKTRIDTAFSSTTALLFGRKFALDKCETLLKNHVPQNLYLKSPISGNKTIVGAFLTRLLDLYDIKRRVLSEKEMRIIGNIHISPETLGRIKLDVDVLSKNLANIAFACFDGMVGNNSNLDKITLTADSDSCYVGSAYILSKRCAHNYWLKECDCVFGSSATWYSSFCISCYWSKKLQRAFQADSCENCTDIYFAHNCENVRDSMFCFNAKNLRHAIGNATLSGENYKKLKQVLLEQITEEIEQTGNLKLDIYALGGICGK